MSAVWWTELAAHFERRNGFPLPELMRPHAKREVLRLAPGSLHEGARAVINSPGLSQKLVDALGMGLTWFNREHKGIASLVTRYREQHRQTGRNSFLVWSAGCSMGQEPYTIAMALRDAGASPIILATDLNREHLRIARAGTYPKNKLDLLPESYRKTYFVPSDAGHAQVVPALRACVSFEHHNFATSTSRPPAWSQFDAIVCRNALIYYAPEEGVRIARGLAENLSPGGALLVGTLERPLLRRLGMDQPGDVALGIRSWHLGGAPVATPPPAPARAPTAPLSAARHAPSSPPEITVDTLLKRAHREHGEAAIATLREAIRRFPLSAAAQLMMGLALHEAGRHEEAIDPLRAARFLDSKSWLATYYLGICLEKRGLEECELAFRDTLELIAAGQAPCSAWIPGVDDKDTVAATVASSCRSRLS